MKPSRSLAVSPLAMGSAGAPAALAQDYPTKPIRAILPLSAGGLGDTVLRGLAAGADARAWARPSWWRTSRAPPP